MVISEMRKKFRDEKKQTKWEFAHDMMGKVHHFLWEYPEYLRGTDINEIRITQNDVLFFCGGVFG